MNGGQYANRIHGGRKGLTYHLNSRSFHLNPEVAISNSGYFHFACKAYEKWLGGCVHLPFQYAVSYSSQKLS